MEMKELAIAFIKAKKSFAPALKSSTNPHFKSKYADLAACLEAVDDSFLANGIVMYQETSLDESGVTVETVLLHESGQSLRGGKLHVPASKQDPQGYGSALSYARRYSLMAACGIAPEDDDGNAATTAYKAQPEKKSTTRPATPGNGEGLPEASKMKVAQAVGEVQSLMQKGMDFEAYEAKQRADLDVDETLHFWTHFDSKQRSALKSIHDSLQKTYGAENLDA